MRKPPAGSRDGGELVRAPYFVDGAMRLYHGDALAVARELPSGAADCIVTSPPISRCAIMVRRDGRAGTVAATMRGPTTLRVGRRCV